MRARAILFLISVAVWSDAAQAQVAPPRFELGGSGGTAVALGGDAALILLIGPRLTFNVTPRDALEVVAEIGGPVENDGMYGLYLIQYQAGAQTACRPPQRSFSDGGDGRRLRVPTVRRNSARNDLMGRCSCSPGTPVPRSRSRFSARSVSASSGCLRATRRCAAISRCSPSDSGQSVSGGLSASPSRLEATVTDNPVLFSAIVTLSTVTLAGCEARPAGSPYVIPGPTGPSQVATQTPYVWDTRDELAVWLGSSVSRGPVSASGEGRSAVIRIETGGPTPSSPDGSRIAWVLRGPDFETPLTGVRAVRIRFVWTPALRNTSVPVAIPDIYATFEVMAPRIGLDQVTLSANTAGESSGEMVLEDRYGAPFTARYVYLHSDGGNRGVLEIDSIALVRDERLAGSR